MRITSTGPGLRCATGLVATILLAAVAPVHGAPWRDSADRGPNWRGPERPSEPAVTAALAGDVWTWQPPGDCPDLTGDGLVNLADLAALGANWLGGGPELAGDLDGDGQVGVGDLAALAGAWGTGPTCGLCEPAGLPYASSFEPFQGFEGGPDYTHPLDRQQGWFVPEGYAALCQGEWLTDAYGYVPFHYVYVDYDTHVRRAFVNTGQHDRQVRLELIPGWRGEVMVQAGGRIAAGVRFAEDFDLHVWDGDHYADTGASYQGAGLSFTELRLAVDWSAGSYRVWWGEDPNAIATASLGVEAAGRLTELAWRTADDWMIVNRVSVSDFTDPGPSARIDQPCYCSVDEGGLSQGRTEIVGHAWWDRLGLYEVMYCPIEQPIEDPNSWHVAHRQSQPVGVASRLGWWLTGTTPNGLYYLGLRLYDDLGLSSGFVMLEEPVGIAGELKSNSFRRSEPPDIEVAWPGLIALEVRRSYDSGQRLERRPYAPGWRDGNHIEIEEDARWYYEGEAGFPGARTYADSHRLGFGWVWVTYPDGGRRLFRHVDGDTWSARAEYQPWPDNDSGDSVVRVSYGDGFTIQRVEYSLERRDGTVYRFRPIGLDIWAPQGEGFGVIGWQWRAPVATAADRFGNELRYAWDATGRDLLQVSTGQGASRLALCYGDEDADGFVEEVRFEAGTPGRVISRVSYDWDRIGQSFRVRWWGEGVDAAGGYHGDPNELVVEQRYEYDLHERLVRVCDRRDPNLAVLEVDYDAWGRVGRERRYVEPELREEVSWSYEYLLADGAAEAELWTRRRGERATTVTRHNRAGAKLLERVEDATGQAVRWTEYAYEDPRHPLEPTEVVEHWDGCWRRTTNAYSPAGELVEQVVYNEQGRPWVTELEYHDVLGLLRRRTSWQGPGRTGERVEQVYEYGRADGTVSLVPGENVCLVAELVRDGPGRWARTEHRYDGRGLVVENRDPNGHYRSFEYDGFGRRSWQYAGRGPGRVAVARELHDEAGTLVLRAGDTGCVELLESDGLGRLWRHTIFDDPDALDPSRPFDVAAYASGQRGVELACTQYGYDEAGRCTFEARPDFPRSPGGIVRTRFNLAGKAADERTFVRSGPGYVQTHERERRYDGRGFEVERIERDLVTGDTARTAFVRDDLGSVTEASWYDFDGGLLKRELRELDGLGRTVLIETWGPTRREGIVRQEYDLHGRVVERVEDPGGLDLRTRREYDGQGNLIAAINPRGYATFYEYDAAGRRTGVFAPVAYDEADPNAARAVATIRERADYYPGGKLACVTHYDVHEPGEAPRVLSRRRYEYDNRGRLSAVRDDVSEDRRVVSRIVHAEGGFQVDALAWDVELTDGAGKATYLRLDPLGKVEAIRRPSGHVEAVSHNADGTIEARGVYDPAGTPRWIEYDYDGHGRLVRTRYPDGGMVEFVRDGLGRLAETLDNRGPAERIGGVGQFANRIATRFDALGRLVRRIDQDGCELIHTWRADGRRETVELFDLAGECLYALHQSYDAAGRGRFITDPRAGADGLLVNLDHDAAGNTTSVAWSLTGALMGPELTLRQQYDAADRLVGCHLEGGPAFGLADVELDGLGRLIRGCESFTDEAGAVHEELLAFEYDRRGQLLHAARTGGGGSWEQWLGYRDDGNLDWRVEPQGETLYEYSGDLLMSATGAETFELAWDHNGRGGNLPADPNATLAWTWDGQLRRVELGDLVIEHRYAPDGARVETRRQGPAGERTTRYLPDATIPGQVLVELDGATGQLEQAYVAAEGRVLMALAGRDPPQRKILVPDRLGSVRLVVDSAGSVLQWRTYGPFGADLAGGGDAGVPYGFAGARREDATGQYWLVARQYDPALARFTGPDPAPAELDAPGTWNAYLYCLNDPVNRIDPTGEKSLGELATTMKVWSGGVAASGYEYAKAVLDRARELINNAIAFRNLMHRLAVSGQRGLDLAVRLGRQGEQHAQHLLDLARNTQRFYTSAGNYRIPDMVDGNVFYEVKNVAYLPSTAQLRDMLEIAQAMGGKLVLVIREGTQLSGPLYSQAQQQGIEILRVLP